MTTTRRNLLKLSAPALAAVAIPSTAEAKNEPLVALLTELRQAQARARAWNKEWCDIEERLDQAGLLFDPCVNDAPEEIRKLIVWCIHPDRPWSIEDVKRDTQGHLWPVGPDDDGNWHPEVRAEYDARRAHGRAKLRWWISEIRRRRAAVEASGYWVVEEKHMAAEREVQAIRAKILATKPCTPVGVAILLTLAAEQAGMDPNQPDDASHSEFPVGERLMLAALRASQSAFLA